MKFRTLTLFSAAALGLAACADAPEEAPAGETNVANLVEGENIGEISTEAPPAERVDNLVTGDAPPTATLAADEQTQEDADATGMTAKVDRTGGNEGEAVR